MATKPLKIVQSPMTGRYYATRSYKVRNEKDGIEYIEITGRKEDITDQIETIVDRKASDVRDVLFRLYQDTVSPYTGLCLRCNVAEEHEDNCAMIEVERVLGVTWESRDWRDSEA